MTIIFFVHVIFNDCITQCYTLFLCNDEILKLSLSFFNTNNTTQQLILSDGVHFFSGMCATQLNHLVHQGTIAQNCILKVNDFIVNTMGSGAKICIILGCDAVGCLLNR